MGKALALDHLQVAMPRGEEPAARAFYGRILGLTEIPKPEPLAARGGLWFECGSQQLHLGVEDDFRPAKKAHPAFVVDDLEELANELEAAGYRVVNDSVQLEGSRRIFTEDPFGNRVELVQTLGRAPASPR
jgi:catechol 2,3-dioxygenase-like lactoylglutathione lyase family enzyme